MTDISLEKPKLRYSRLALAFGVSFVAVLILEVIGTERLNVFSLQNDFLTRAGVRTLVGLPVFFVMYKFLNRKEFPIGLTILLFTWAIFTGWLGIVLFRGSF